MKDYTDFLNKKRLLEKYRRIRNKSIDDYVFERKYNKLGIHNRKEFIILKNEKPNVIKNFQVWTDNIELIYKQKGMNCLGGRFMRACGKTGPTDMPRNNKGNADIIHVVKQYDISDIWPVNYNKVFNTKPDNLKDYKDKLFNLRFDRYIENEKKRKMYKRYEQIYNNDKSNSNLDIINDLILRVSKYAEESGLKRDNTYIDSGVICSISLMISERIKTGVLNTDFTRFDSYTLDELNEEYNTYIVFLVLNMLTCRQHRFQQTYNGEVLREKWYINHLQRRKTMRVMRTTCVLPIFDKDEYGNIILYDDNKDE